jgi:hypothetical protein
VYSCQRIPGRVLSHNDCNDAKAAINPAAAEICDGLDNNCNGVRDFRLGVNDFEDDDNDDVADAKCTGGEDCDDTDATTGDGKDEVCDGRDNDCDDATDEQTAQTVWFLDKDGDGFGTEQGTALARCEPIPGRAAILGDCDDSVNAIHPGAIEQCNGDDDDCNGIVDDGTNYLCQASRHVGDRVLVAHRVVDGLEDRGELAVELREKRHAPRLVSEGLHLIVSLQIVKPRRAAPRAVKSAVGVGALPQHLHHANRVYGDAGLLNDPSSLAVVELAEGIDAG